MSPDNITSWAAAIGGLVRQLHDMGIPFNPVVLVVVFALMVVVKRVDRRAWERSGKKRGARPGDNGYLVAWYPGIPLLLGGLCGAGWWGLVDGGQIGQAVVDGIVSGALLAAGFAAIKSLMKYRKLLAKLKAEGGG